MILKVNISGGNLKLIKTGEIMHYQPPGAELKLLPGPSQSYANLASHMGHAYGKSPVKTYEIHLHSSIKSQTYGYG